MNRIKTNSIRVLLFAMLAIVLACGKVKNKDIAKSENQSNDIIELIISYENLTTQTFVRIACDELEQTFEKSLNKKVLRNKNEINEIVKSIDRTLKQANYTENIDVRFKMILTHTSEERDTICGNGSVIRVKNKNYRIDKEFTNLLKSLTETE